MLAQRPSDVLRDLVEATHSLHTPLNGRVLAGSFLVRQDLQGEVAARLGSAHLLLLIESNHRLVPHSLWSRIHKLKALSLVHLLSLC